MKKITEIVESRFSIVPFWSQFEWLSKEIMMKNMVFELAHQLRVVGLLPYFEDFECTWVLQVLRVSSDSDEFSYEKIDFWSGGTSHFKVRKGVTKSENVVFELVDRVRVAGLPPYFEDFEYSWVIRVLRVSSDSDDFSYEKNRFLEWGDKSF